MKTGACFSWTATSNEHDFMSSVQREGFERVEHFEDISETGEELPIAADHHQQGWHADHDAGSALSLEMVKHGRLRKMKGFA